MAAVVVGPRWNKTIVDIVRHTRQQWQRSSVQRHTDTRRPRHFQRVSRQAETGDVRGGWQTETTDGLARHPVEATAPVAQDSLAFSRTFPSGLDGRGKNTRSQRFCQHQCETGPKA